jgi:hypothetical protein
VRLDHVKRAAWYSVIPTLIAIYTVFLPEYKDIDTVTSDPNQFWWDLFQFVGKQYITLFGPLLGLSAFFGYRKEKKRRR